MIPADKPARNLHYICRSGLLSGELCEGTVGHRIARCRWPRSGFDRCAHRAEMNVWPGAQCIGNQLLALTIGMCMRGHGTTRVRDTQREHV